MLISKRLGLVSIHYTYSVIGIGFAEELRYCCTVLR